MEEFESRQAGSGGTALKGSEQKKKSNNRHTSATKATAGIVAKRATGLRTVGNQGRQRRSSPQMV